VILALFLALALAGQSVSTPSLAFIYAGGESTGPAEIRRALAPLGVRVSVFAPGTDGDSLNDDTDLSAFDIVFVDGSADGLDRYAHQLRSARARTQVVVVRPSASTIGNVSLDAHPWIERYWSNPSQKNYARLAQYLLARVAVRPHASARIEPPVEYPAQGFYHPDAEALFGSAAEYLTWYGGRNSERTVHTYDPAKLTIGIFFNLTSYQVENLEHINALVREVEGRGHNVVALTFRGSPTLASLIVDRQSIVDTLIFAGSVLNVKDRAAALDDARRLDVPILGGLTHSGLTPEAFAESPTGLHPALTPTVVDAERDGRIEPIVIAGKGASIGDRTAQASIPHQVRWRVDRALAWAKLHRTPNGRKRVLFTFWSEGGGKANLGGDPDDFLDVQATLVRLLGELKDRGYDVGAGPIPDRDTLSRRMALSASNVGTWAPGELARRVQRNEVRLIPEETYRQWFDTLPANRRAEIVEMWGPPPGKVMVHRAEDGRRFLVVPSLEFGNVLVAPHPDWGYLQDQKALMSTGALPPHHQYVAFFLWLQREWHADAWVSLFTNISLQPGKSEGPAADDHIALLLGSLPHIHPERLGANGGVANKRKAMAQTVGWYNIVGPSKNAEAFFPLRASLARYEGQTDAQLRADAEPVIRAEVVRTGLDRSLNIDAATTPMSSLLTQVRAELDAMDRALGPVGTKVLGDAPEGTALDDMVSAMLGKNGQLEGAVSTGADHQQLAREYADRLRTAPREVEGILEALGGRWIEPGPMDEPVRKPDSLPPGRALYNFDQAAIPTPEAEAIGVRQAEALIAVHREKHNGAYPTKLAFVIWSGELAKNLGVTEAQVLHLLGTRPVRDARGAVTGVELISREALGRPRVDVMVTTSGTYRDHYQDKVALIAEAVRLASASPEPDNPVAAATHDNLAKLTASGTAAGRAESLAQARVFSPAPGAYSPSIQFLAKSGDQRGDEARMAELYTSRMSHAYGGGLFGDAARSVFEQHAARIDAVTLPRSSNVNGMLDHPMSAGFLGGLNLAARAAGARDIALYVSNLRDETNPSIESAAHALQTEMRTRYFNKAWLSEMKAHGYDGARNLMFFTDHLDLWDTTATDMVSSKDWDEVKRVYVDDSLDLDLDGFFDRHNPYAQQVLLANLLGASSRGHWNASPEDLAMVASRLARSATEHGAVCEATICRNPALTKMVGDTLANVPGGAALAAAYRGAIEQATRAPGEGRTTATGAAPGSRAATGPPAAMTATSTAPLISGRALEEVLTPAGQPTPLSRSLPWWALGVIAAALMTYGWLRPRGLHR
jgi:cobaltochelatase CobN